MKKTKMKTLGRTAAAAALAVCMTMSTLVSMPTGAYASEVQTEENAQISTSAQDMSDAQDTTDAQDTADVQMSTDAQTSEGTYKEAEAQASRDTQADSEIQAAADALSEEIENTAVEDDQETQVRAFVERLYTLVLGRASDATGIDEWTQVLLSGKESGAKVAQGFVDSVEFKERNLSDRDYLTVLYRTFLNREPDESGFEAWEKVLNTGFSRLYVCRGFAESDEFTDICDIYGISRGNVELTEARDQNDGVTKFVARAYEYCLGRSADVAGLNDWCSQILNGTNTAQDTAYGFIFSSEFTEKNLSNEEFVTVMYRVFFDREPDAAGYKTWVNVLKSGSPRLRVYKGFAYSDEFKKLCASYGVKAVDLSKAEQQAIAVLDQVGWNLKAAYKWATSLSYERGAGYPGSIPAGTSHIEYYASYGFTHKTGLCYVYASTFTLMARELGYEAYMLEGQVPYVSGGYGLHGWCEIVINGTTYVCDPNFEWEEGRNGYMITYGASGTWPYRNGKRVE